MNKVLLVFALFLLLTFDSKPLHAEQIEIEIDGKLEETLWQRGQRFNDFKVTQPLSLAKPSNNTEVLVYSNQQGLYIGFVNQQEESESITSRSLKDADINSDYNEVVIDFDAQSVRAFGFKVSKSGSAQDAIWTDENRESVDWDGDWQYAVQVDDDEWVTEIFIPWSIVSMLSAEENQRRVKLYFSRWHQGKNTRYSYPAIDRSQKTFLGNFAPLRLTSGESSSLDFFPYISYNEDIELHNHATRFGADIFWKPTSAQQLNVTLNPDFGQVESDDLVVNFSAVETFFSEKRPFFRENHDLFDLQGPQNLRLVHTPRIGGENDIEGSIANDINGAIRYNYIGQSLDIGLLSAFEDDHLQAHGSDYFAVRAQYKLDHARLGLLQTRTENPALARESTVSVLDFQLEPIDELRLTGQLLTTHIKMAGVNSDDNGWWLGAEWEPSEQLSHELYLFDFGQNMDVSDFGFIERVNRQQWNYEGSYVWTKFKTALRDIEWSWSIEAKNNAQKQDLPMAYASAALFTFKTTSAVELEYESIEQGIDDLITRGNNPLRFPRSDKLSATYISQQNRAVTYEVGMGIGYEFLKGQLQEIEFRPAFQITDNCDLNVEIEWERSDSWVIWDEANELEEFKRNELTIALNFNAIVADRHEFRLKLESVALEATALNEYATDVNGNLTVNDAPPDSFSLSEFATQVRYRYELGPLSELFIVYSRGGEFEAEGLGLNTLSLLNRSISRDHNENLLVKLKMHF